MLLCVDVGSTFTKAALVDGETGELLATASTATIPDPRQPTCSTGWTRAVPRSLADHPEASAAEVLACSSAGGGLRIAVVGNEELVTAEAGRRVALSSGGKVVAVLGRTSPDAAFGELDATTRPDVVLLTGGTDDGDEEGILDGARRLAASGWQGPVVVAGNVAAQGCGRRGAGRAGRSWSPTTWCRGSAYSRPSRRAGRSARCSWRT